MKDPRDVARPYANASIGEAVRAELRATVVLPEAAVGAAPLRPRTWMQVATSGAFRGHAAGEFEFTRDEYAEIAKNFARNPNGRIPVDFEHATEAGTEGSIPQKGAPAQGWIVSLRYDEGQLEGECEWIPSQPGLGYVREGAYLYVSPAVAFESVDRVTGKAIGCELLSVALTNRPFILGMRPLAARDAKGTGVPETKVVQGRAIPARKYAVVDEPWDADAAVARVRKWASSDGSGGKDTIDWAKYAQAFTWYDDADKESFGGYKLPHHDVKDGKLVTSRRGVIAAAGVLLGARGGVDIPDSDLKAVKRHIAQHYREMDMQAPWEREERAGITNAQPHDEDAMMIIERMNAERGKMRFAPAGDGVSADAAVSTGDAEAIRGEAVARSKLAADRRTGAHAMRGEMSLSEIAEIVCKKINNKLGYGAWVVEIYDDRVIFCWSDRLYTVDYAVEEETEGNYHVKLAEQASEVRRAYVPVDGGSTMTMKMIAKELEMDEGAGADAIVAKVSGLKAELKTANAAVLQGANSESAARELLMSTREALGIERTAGPGVLAKHVAELTARAAIAEKLEAEVKTLRDEAGKRADADAEAEVDWIVRCGERYKLRVDESSRKALRAYRKADAEGFATDYKAALDGMRARDPAHLFSAVASPGGSLSPTPANAAPRDVSMSNDAAFEIEVDRHVAEVVKGGGAITRNAARGAVHRKLMSSLS